MPRVTQTSNVGNAFAIQGTLDEAGTVYAQVRLSASAAPSSADLVNDAGTFVSAASWSVTGEGEAAANYSITGSRRRRTMTFTSSGVTRPETCRPARLW